MIELIGLRILIENTERSLHQSIRDSLVAPFTILFLDSAHSICRTHLLPAPGRSLFGPYAAFRKFGNTLHSYSPARQPHSGRSHLRSIHSLTARCVESHARCKPGSHHAALTGIRFVIYLHLIALTKQMLDQLDQGAFAQVTRIDVPSRRNSGLKPRLKTLMDAMSSLPSWNL